MSTISHVNSMPYLPKTGVKRFSKVLSVAVLKVHKWQGTRRIVSQFKIINPVLCTSRGVWRSGSPFKADVTRANAPSIQNQKECKVPRLSTRFQKSSKGPKPTSSWVCPTSKCWWDTPRKCPIEVSRHASFPVKLFRSSFTVLSPCHHILRFTNSINVRN